MKNKVKNGKTTAYVVPNGQTVAPGDLIVQGNQPGVAIDGGTEGEDLELDTDGVFNIPKKTGEAFTVGQKLYWDATAKKLSGLTTDGGSPAVNLQYVGWADSAAGSSATTANLKLATP